ncbi:hypothetical protein FH972_009407 [Carpinus fangiana]|uniref:Bidirectional sugar transporter SWEET n=1 Tax=Carpinus fangiana TaxID=176857 RepID=A0A5N6R1T8_9ROSI|nr:hypothetical protein FH972_009407 [Carpinus fangiana]
MLWLYYALLKKNAELLITINSFGCVVEMIYIAMYIAYAPNVPRKFTVKVFVSMNMGLFSLIALTSHFLVNGSHRVKVLGWICVAISLPNVLGFVLGLLQMLLYGLYRNSKRVTAEQNIKSIVILSTLGASEVYPLDAQVPYIANKDAKEHEQTVVDLEKSMEPPVHELQAIECAV